MVKIESSEMVQFSRYFRFCNELCLCDVRAIPTCRVYQPYDSNISSLNCTIDTDEYTIFSLDVHFATVLTTS